MMVNGADVVMLPAASAVWASSCWPEPWEREASCAGVRARLKDPVVSARVVPRLRLLPLLSTSSSVTRASCCALPLIE